MQTHPFIAAGIDGGGSSTRVVLVDEHGRVLGAGLGGPANYHSVGLATAERNLSTAFEAAWKEAGQSPRFCDRAFLGLAGVATDEDRLRMMEVALRIGIGPEDRIAIDHDMRIALAGALPDRIASTTNDRGTGDTAGTGGTGGIVLIAGTGSVAFGQSPDGRTARAGGMGHVFDDAGSGYDIGSRAIIAAIRAADGRGQTTSLSAIIEQAFGGHLRQIVTGLSPIPTKRENIARLAPHVIDAAEQGDAVAVNILEAAGDELASCIVAVAKQLSFPADAPIPIPIPIAITGGLASVGERFTSYIHRAVASRLPNAEWIAPAMEPVLGAAWLALQSGGHANDQALAVLCRK